MASPSHWGCFIVYLLLRWRLEPEFLGPFIKQFKWDGCSGRRAWDQAELPQQACQRELPSALGVGIYGSCAVQARLPPWDYARVQHRGMQDGLLGSPESHSQEGGLLPPGSCILRDLAVHTAGRYRFVSPALCSPHSIHCNHWPSGAAAAGCPGWQGSALQPPSGRECHFGTGPWFGSQAAWRYLYPPRQRCSCARDNEVMPAFRAAASSPRVLLLQHAASQVGQKPWWDWHWPFSLPPQPVPSPGRGSHSIPNCAIATPWLRCFGTGPLASCCGCMSNGCIPANPTACGASPRARHGPGGSITWAINKLVRSKRICEWTIGGSKSSAETNLHHRKTDICVRGRKAQSLKRKKRKSNLFLLTETPFLSGQSFKIYQSPIKPEFAIDPPSALTYILYQDHAAFKAPIPPFPWLSFQHLQRGEAQPVRHSNRHWRDHTVSLLAHEGAAVPLQCFSQAGA